MRSFPLAADDATFLPAEDDATFCRRRRHRRDASVGGKDWDGAIILPEITRGGGGVGGRGIVVVV